MSRENILSITVNGETHVLPFIAGEMLADLLRERLGLTGTKVGCNEAECGACTVLVDGTPVLSCAYPAGRAQGKEVITIEGIASLAVDAGERKSLHPVQEAFIRWGAVQCGFCTPGQIITAYALLKRKPNPSQGEIRQAMNGVLCRCGCYPAIERAILAASQAIQQGTEVRSPSFLTLQANRNAIGTAHPRPDAIQKVTGAAKYTDDLHFPGMVHARVKRAGIPHAILRHLDVNLAKALPGVFAVLTAEDLPAGRLHGLERLDWPILIGIGERVRYVGDAVAIVAAETRDIATQAMELIIAEYEFQPVVKGAVEARQPDAPVIHEQGNLLKQFQVRKGDIRRGFEGSHVVLEHTFHTPIAEQLFMEPECSIAQLTPQGRMEIYVGSQIPYSDRQQVAAALGWPEERVHIIGQFVGGAFGGKEDIAGQIHAALLAQATGRPVKLLFNRHESMLVHPKRHATQIHIKIGVQKDGEIRAIQTELYGDT